MKIVKILGGLGNQMFQYALALSLSHQFPREEIKIDISAFNLYPSHNGYELSNIFKDTFCIATIKECAKVGYPLPNYRLWQIGSRLLPTRHSMIRETSVSKFNENVFNPAKKYFDGYWQSEKYFQHIRSDILKCFSFTPFNDDDNLKLMNEMLGKCNVSVHVRRGDYLNIPLYKGICSKKYYREAIKKILSDTQVDRFIVFSNDIDWVKENLNGYFENIEICYVDWNKGQNSYRDMQLMSLCTHNIVANSSFSWWGAWLNRNPNKIVIAPSKWINLKEDTDIIPSSWIKIDE